MFTIGKTIVSEAVIEHDFVCNLHSCKGACCVEGNAGAPLEKQEAETLEMLYPKIEPFLSKKGRDAIAVQGTAVKRDQISWETPLVQDAECAYVFFDENNRAKCGIEEAYNKGYILWKKPVSCHLYPVRIVHYSSFTAVNYHKWDICNAACVLGEAMQTPVYQYVKEALVRKFGADWYHELEKVAETLKKT